MSDRVNLPIAASTLQELNQRFEDKPPQEVLAYALNTYFPHIILGCSFGAEDVVLVDMMYRINPKAPLFYLDTDFLFPETYEVRDRIISKYGLSSDQVFQMKSRFSPDEQTQEYGAELWARQPDLCCQLRKVDPLTRILKNYSAWITGIRRDQSPTRDHTQLLEWDNAFGLVKINPLAKWTTEDVWTHIRDQQIPYNVLHDKNYPSIGCTHCTVPVMPGEDPRSGRWQNSEKTECGLHKR